MNQYVPKNGDMVVARRRLHSKHHPDTLYGRVVRDGITNCQIQVLNLDDKPIWWFYFDAFDFELVKKFVPFSVGETVELTPAHYLYRGLRNKRFVVNFVGTIDCVGSGSVSEKNYLRASRIDRKDGVDIATDVDGYAEYFRVV